MSHDEPRTEPGIDPEDGTEVAPFFEPAVTAELVLPDEADLELPIDAEPVPQSDGPRFESHDEPKPRIRGRDVAVVAGRTTAGVVVAALAAGVAFASTFIVPPTWSATPPSLVATPTAAPQQLICPGGLLRLGNDSGEGASTASPIGSPWTAWGADTSVELRTISGTNAGTLGTPAAAEIGTVAVAEQGAPLAAGLQSELVAAGIEGLATAACTAPASEQWLVAGATTLGRTSLLVITNPTAVEAVVDIELYGENGQVGAAGLEGIRLAPDEQRVLPLNGFAVDLTAPVVRVVSTGGRVAAAVQQSIVRSLAPGGVDLVSSQRPATSLVIPGVRVQTRGELAPIDVNELDHDDISPVLRLFAPGSTEVAATVALIPHGTSLADALAAIESPEAEAPGDAHADHEHDGEGDEVPEPRSFQVTLTPGLVTEHAIEQVAAGDYTVIVTAAQPVVGAVRTSTLAPATSPDAPPRVDFAWATPAAAMSDRAVFALPRLTDSTGGVPGVSSAAPGAAQPPAGQTALPAATVPELGALPGYLLWIVNPGDAAAMVGITFGDGTSAQLEIAPGAAEWVQLSAESSIALDGMRGLSAAILAAGQGLLAQAPLQAPGQLASEILVRF